MIGQNRLQSELEQVIESGTLSPFVILVGFRGSGKKLMAHWIGQKLQSVVIDDGKSVNDVRTAIENSYKVRSSTTHIFADADTMSPEAKSALLKVTEEPPNNTHFVMTLESLASMPATIASRAAVYYMDRYTPQELKEYAGMIGVDADIWDVCDTPGDIEIFKTIDIPAFMDYVELVVDNVADVSTGNSLKIGGKIALKEDADGYDLKLFWKAFIRECMKRAEAELPNKVAFDYASGAMLTSKYLSELNVRGVNRNMLFLDWVLLIRKEWA